MSRFKLLLLGACLIASLSTFGQVERASAQTTSARMASNDPLPAQASANPAANANAGNPSALKGPEQRVALVIGNSNYQNAPRLTNPTNDAQSIAQFLSSAGFEVTAATDLTLNDMIRVVQDFSSKISTRGPNTAAMIFYAGHGVQLAGENYLVPVDARISSESDLVSNSLRLVDIMATLEAVPSRIRIVVLDACRNNPFPTVNEATRGLAIVDAPNGSIVGYSTAPGTAALDGDGNHSPYASAFLRVAHEPNVPIEQLFKRIRLEVNNSTGGRQTPWESSSLTSDFYFFGDTAVASARAPAPARMAQTASNLPSRAVREAYDYVLAEGSPEYYQEFINLYPHDPRCDRIRALLANLTQAAAWHKAVLANSPPAYKAFSEKYAGSPYAQTALKLQLQPKSISALQPTRIIVPPQLTSTYSTNPGLSKDKDVTVGRVVTMPPVVTKLAPNDLPSSDVKKIVTLPARGTTAKPPTEGGTRKVVTFPVGKFGIVKTNQDQKTIGQANRGRIGDIRNANSNPRFGSENRFGGPSMQSAGGGFGRGRFMR